MNLSVIKPERAQIREEVVKMLESILEEAREGKVAAIGLAIVRPDSHINCGFTDYDCAGLMLGATALFQSRLLANMHAKDE